MNRRNFFKRALGMVGAGLLAGSIEPQPPAIGSDAWWELQGVVSKDRFTYEIAVINNAVIPDHTHSISPYPSVFTVFDLEELG